MQEIIGRILEGNFDYENGSLDFSCSKLELTLYKGEIAEGSFFIYGEPGRFTEGRVSASDLRMECLTTCFAGESEEISYCFHGEYMEEGDVVRGNFCIVSNQGEYYLPFVVSVEHSVLESSIGSIKNLFHFANLAKSSWQEAVRLFYTPEFPRLLQGSDSQYYECYRGLSVYPDNEQNVEEFLIRINKKQRVDFIAREESLVLEIEAAGSGYAVTEAELNIVRNGWGYTALQVECEGDFVFTEKEFLSDDDFLGNRCRLPVYIDAALCRNGRNFGRIYVYNSYVSLTVPVTVRLGGGTAAGQARLARRKDTVKLMTAYEAFRLKKAGTGAWLKETRELVEQWVTADDQDVSARLFQAQLLISEERYNEAEWALDYAEDLLERAGETESTLRAYLLYLTTLIRREDDYIDQVTAQVEQLYRRERDNWRVAWLLLYLSEEYNKTAAVKWDFLERQFGYGCTSPVLYVEALGLLNANPTLLRRLDRYSLQVLYFGVRGKALKPEVLEQLLYLSGKAREYSPVLLKILTKCYEGNQDVRVLQEICALLIKAGRVGQAYFHWYKAGVEANVRITNLFEYYMMSIDLDSANMLPKTVLMYFSYQNNLDYEHRAFLYNYVQRNRLELGELYGSYRSKIELFVLDQIRRERIDRNLAGLYGELLTPALVNEQTAEHLARILFAHQIRVEDLRLKKVFVYQPDNLLPGEYVLQDGVAWVSVYGNDYTILFEDAYGNRFVKSVDYTLEKLMLPGKALHLLGGWAQNCPELDIYLCEGEKETENLSEDNRERATRVAESGSVDISFRRKLYMKLLHYYYEQDDEGAMDRCLKNMPGEKFSMEERGEVLRYMVLRNHTREAWEWVRQYSPYFVDPKILLRLVSEMIERSDGVEDAYLVCAAHCSFRRGKYDSRLLQYLVDHLQGTTKELRDVWKAARSFELDCYKLSERMLVQMLYSGAYVGERMDIFRYYVAQGTNTGVEEAFLVQCSYDYFVRERLTESIVFAQIRRMYLGGGKVQKVCKLAFLKYYGENAEEITPEILFIAGEFLQEMMENRIHLNFFRNYAGMSFPQERLLRELMDKTIVEYRAHPGAKAKIHYVVQRANENEAEYLTESMREAYGGVCFKEFVLFFGDYLQYYIVEEEDGEEQLTESGNLQKNDIRSEGAGGRYEMINDIAISRTLQDYDTLDSLVEEYCHREFLHRGLFVLQ